ncbi:MAG: RluA family pseudouridine synthase [Clostridiales bacterium]|nr:RluA family pseudouridine synthase [Clostridiales bacterium]
MDFYTVDENFDGARLDAFLAQKLNVSRSLIKNVLEERGAYVSGALKKKAGCTLKLGDEVQFELPPPKSLDVKAEDIPLDIIYQDECFAIINKKQGMVVHPAAGHEDGGTLVNAILHSIKDLSGINGVYRPGIVHRLDKDTSGLLIVAKNDEAHKAIAKQIEKKTARRIYLGIVVGNVKEDEGLIDKPIGRSEKDRKKMAITEKGKSAQTLYSVIERFGNYTLMKFELKTGRTHQIRVHMKSINHPIAGDTVYGGGDELHKEGQLLHAHKLILTHPKTGEEMSFEAPLPDYFIAVLEKLRKRIK